MKDGFCVLFKKCGGSPEFVARGLAVGVFVGITPTMPFQTALALALAALFRGSKPAAVLGIWSGNPLTTPLLYAGSFRLGKLLFGTSAVALSLQQQSFGELLRSGAHFCCAAIAGGMLIGILPAIIVYFAARRTMDRMQYNAVRRLKN